MTIIPRGTLIPPWLITKKDCKPLDLRNINILLKTLSNQIQQYIKRRIHHDQIGIFIPEMQDLFSIWKPISVSHFINRIKKNYMVFSVVAEKIFAKFSILIHIYKFKNYQQMRSNREQLQEKGKSTITYSYHHT